MGTKQNPGRIKRLGVFDPLVILENVSVVDGGGLDELFALKIRQGKHPKATSFRGALALQKPIVFLGERHPLAREGFVEVLQNDRGIHFSHCTFFADL